MNWPPTRAEKKSRTIYDIVHGTIKIFYPVSVLLDTKEVQRLRGLKQLGLTHLVYPSCVHNRFSHSIGTYHLAFKLVKELRQSYGDLIDDSDHLCVCVAALLHDLGHGPFSHLFDGSFRDAVGNTLPKHEEMSIRLIKRLFSNSIVKQAFESHLGSGATFDRNVEFICELVSSKKFGNNGAWLPVGRGIEKSFLYDIVSNDEDGNDVDKWDYLLRDSMSTNIGINFNRSSVERLIENVCICSPNEVPSHKRLAWFEKVEQTIGQVGEGRMTLHDTLYQHKTVRGIEEIVVHALKLAAPFLLFKGEDGRMYPLDRVTEDLGAFLRTNDSILDTISNSTNEEMTVARELLEDIERRQILQRLDEEHYSPAKADQLIQSFGNPNKSVKDLVKKVILERLIEYNIDENNIILIPRILHKGMGKVNPLTRVLLVDKNQNPIRVDPERVRLRSAESAEICKLGIYVPRGTYALASELICETFDQVMVDFGFRSQSRYLSPNTSQSSSHSDSGLENSI